MNVAAGTQPSDRVKQSASLRASVTRRARIIRRLTLMGIATLAAVAVTLWNRDMQAFVAEERRFNFWKAYFVDLHAQGKISPLEVPSPPKSNRRIWDVYGYNITYPTDALNHGRTAVIFRRSALDQFLGESGRHALVYDGNNFSVVWLPGSEPSAEAKALGIDTAP
jgi:hypothetical protein